MDKLFASPVQILTSICAKWLSYIYIKKNYAPIAMFSSMQNVVLASTLNVFINSRFMLFSQAL